MKKKILLFLGLIFLFSGIRLFFGGDEDQWICNNGKWVKHGNPYSEMPKEDCF